MTRVEAWLAVPGFPICGDGQKYIVPPGYACRQLNTVTRRDSWVRGGGKHQKEGRMLNCLNIILLGDEKHSL